MKNSSTGGSLGQKEKESSSESIANLPLEQQIWKRARIG